MKYPKHLLVIGDKKFDIGNNFSLEEDFDTNFQTLTFEFPYIDTPHFKTTDIKKYDSCQLYFNWFNSAEERDAALIDDMVQCIYGYIDSYTRSESKESGLNYNITVKSTFGLAFERSAERSSFKGNIETITTWMLQSSSVINYLNGINYKGLSKGFEIKADTSKFPGVVLKSFSEKYAINVFQTGDGILRVWTPLYMLQQDVNVYEYDLETNIFNIDYGDGQNNVDCVIVHGIGNSGVAFDPIAIQLKYNLDLLPTPETIDQGLLNPLHIERRDLHSETDCQKVAQEKMVELGRNYTITISTEYNPSQFLGDMFVIKNSLIIPETQKWIIKKRSVTITKDNIECSIVAYSNSVTDFPDNILISQTGILDTDMLDVTDKVTFPGFP